MDASAVSEKAKTSPVSCEHDLAGYNKHKASVYNKEAGDSSRTQRKETPDFHHGSNKNTSNTSVCDGLQSPTFKIHYLAPIVDRHRIIWTMAKSNVKMSK